MGLLSGFPANPVELYSYVGILRVHRFFVVGVGIIVAVEIGDSVQRLVLVRA
jgi:hypothetical protein